MTSFNNFADLASFVAASRENDGLTQTYEGAFIEHSEMAKLSIVEAPEALDMPDPEQVRAATEMMMQTMFDVLRDTRMEPFAADLAWGFANSFHVVAKRIEGREDDAAKKLGDLARSYDPSEIYATELEDTQLLCQTLQGCREAMECMRDHAAGGLSVETGKPSPRSRVSSALTASMIEARDYLASKARERREQFAPKARSWRSPVVRWEDVDLLWNGLDSIKARIPEMILATTAQAKGCDAVAHAWRHRGVKVIQFRLDRSQGNRAAFVRNDRILGLKPVEAVICEGLASSRTSPRSCGRRGCRCTSSARTSAPSAARVLA
jgi:hypothetical protein